MSTSSTALTLHRHPLSGHSHRVQLLLSLLGVPATLVDVDLPGGEDKAAPFLALDTFGQVPVLVDGYPNVRAWLQRIEALPGFVPMASTAAGLLTA